MGSGESKAAQSKNQSKGKSANTSSNQSVLQAEYRETYAHFQVNPLFFTQLFVQSASFIANLTHLYAPSFAKETHFFELMMYLRKSDATVLHDALLAANAKQSSLLDRYFMILLDMRDFSIYSSTSLASAQLDSILMQFFGLFYEKPQPGSISKLLKFMKMEEDAHISLPSFTANLREAFPQIQKFLKDYYHAKFNQRLPKAYLLSNFRSKVILNDGIILALKMPRLMSPEIVELFNSEIHGIGFHSIQRKLVGYTGPWLLLVHHSEKNEQNVRENYIFGAYQSGPIRNVLSHQGDITGFLFSVEPTIRFMTTDRGSGANHYFCINSIAEQKSKRRRGFGFGGDADKKNFKLWIDQDLDRSTINNGNDPCYGYGLLAGSKTTKLNVRRMEVWGLGSQFNIEQQTEYWRDRDEQIMKRRKVDKRELLEGGNAELFFGSTFAHRDQIVGEAARPKENKDQE